MSENESKASSRFGDTGSYQAQAFAPSGAGRTLSGQLRVVADSVRFEAEGISGALPLEGLIARRGGHNGEQIFFEHPRHPGWSIYSSDRALVQDPILSVYPQIVRQLRAAERSKRALPPVVWFGTALAALFLAGLVAIWLWQDRIVDYIVDKIPVSLEAQFGDQVFRSFEGQGKMLTDSPWLGPVEGVTSRLLPVVASSGYEFKFHILQDTNVNAFAIPGGHVVIMTGLLERARTPEEVAGVLAHELAHVTRRHSLRNMVKSAGLTVVFQMLLGDAAGLMGLATEGSRYLLGQKFSRDFEREADETGWGYLLEAKINPQGLIGFFELMKEIAAASGAGALEDSLALVNTHPPTQERMDRLQAKWRELPEKSGFVKLGNWHGK